MRVEFLFILMFSRKSRENCIFDLEQQKYVHKLVQTKPSLRLANFQVIQLVVLLKLVFVVEVGLELMRIFAPESLPKTLQVGLETSCKSSSHVRELLSAC